MFNSDQPERNSDAPKPSLAEWLHGVTHDFFHLPGETDGSGVGCYTGRAISSEMAGPAEAADFSVQISRLQIALAGVGNPRVEEEVHVRRAFRMMIPVNREPPDAIDSGSSF